MSSVILADKTNSDVVVVLVTVLDLELDHLRINSQFQCVAAVCVSVYRHTYKISSIYAPLKD
jgi:hypothetical protein